MPATITNSLQLSPHLAHWLWCWIVPTKLCQPGLAASPTLFQAWWEGPGGRERTPHTKVTR